MSRGTTLREPAAATDGERVDERLALGGRSLREHAARGALINSAFQIGLAALGFLRRFAVAAFLTRAEFGLWGILVTTVMTLMWIKQLGVSDKYVQQSEDDQEAAYQKAFTLELLYSVVYFVLVAVALPVYALAYSKTAIIVPGLVLALTVPLSAFETPVWIFYRRMEFVKQRTLGAVDPVVALLVTIGLALAGTGYWCLVLGTLAGTLAGGTAATRACPYRLRLRFDGRSFRQYWSFSWPLLGYSFSNMLVIQGSVLVGNRVVGLAGLGAVGLATSISSFADRVDGIVSQTIYPAVCAVADQTDKLFEAFVKSNRLALAWGMPFGVGVALFGEDLVRYAFGPRWLPAAGLLSAYGVICGLSQVGFNYAVFMRAVSNTKPMFISAVFNVLTFFALGVPCVILFGLPGYAIGFGAMTVVQILVRGYFLSRLFGSFRMWRHLLRAIAPTLPAAGAILALRALTTLPTRPEVALAELVLYVAATIAATAAFERPLIREILGYVRPRPAGAGA